MSDPIPLPLTRAAIPVNVKPGGEIILRGSLYSSQDGSRIDAATTTWPSNAPGGPSVDSGGLFDLEGGGFHLVSRDPVTHEVHAVARSTDAPLCSLHNVQAPCLPLRLDVQARSRLLETRDWHASLSGTVAIEVVEPPLYAPAVSWTTQAAPELLAAGLVLAVIVATVGLFAWLSHRSSTPSARLLALARRVRSKAANAAPLVAAPLTPALDSAERALRKGRVDPRSPQGAQIAAVLQRLEGTLDQAQRSAREAEESQIALELGRDVEIALEAAAEAARVR